MADATEHVDAVLIGAGFSGLYMLKSLRDRLGLRVRVYEAGETVGGTWYWNRYPGARCDSDAYIYCFTFDRQLLQQWTWSERYPEQPEILRYLEHVDWVADCIEAMGENEQTVIEATAEAQDAWVEHVNEIVNMTLMTGANSWYMSANIPGKLRTFLPYLGPEGVGGYRKTCDEIAAKGYEGFSLT